MPGGARISMWLWLTATSISSSLSSSSPSRSFLRNLCRADDSSAASVRSPKPRAGGEQHVENALLGRVLGARTHVAHRRLARLLDSGLHEITHDGIDVAADVAHLGELRRFDLDERCVGELCQAARDLGFADSGRPDHQDVLRRDFLAQRLGDLLPAPAVAQSDRHGAFRPMLADDVFIQLVDDLLRRHPRHVWSRMNHSNVSTTTFWFV